MLTISGYQLHVKHLLFCIIVLLLLILDEPGDDGNGVYQVSLKSQQVMECALEFQPSEVFVLYPR